MINEEENMLINRWKEKKTYYGRYILILSAILFTSILTAKHSDDFLIGDYSSAYDVGNNNTQVLQLLKNANFNYLRHTINDNHDANDISSILQVYDDFGMDVRLKDTSKDQSSHGAYWLTLANFWKFEVEFLIDDKPIDTNLETDNHWFYGFRCEEEDSQQVSIINDDNTTRVLKVITSDDLEPEDLPINIIDKLKKRKGMGSDSTLRNLIYHSEINGDLTLIFNMKHMQDYDGINENVCRLGIKVCVEDVFTKEEYKIDIYDLDSFVPSVSTHIYKENYFNEQYQDLEFSFNPDLLTPEVISSYFNDNGSYQLKKIEKGGIRYLI